VPVWNDGLIQFNGEIITNCSTSELLKKGLLYIPQKNNLFEELTVKENLEMAGLTLGKKKFKSNFDNVLAQFELLTPQLNRVPMSMSGGERQMLTLSMVALHEPKMILFDEPFTGLSPSNINFLISQLKRLTETSKLILVIVEHRITEALKIVNKIIGMKLGRIELVEDHNAEFDVALLHNLFI